MVKLLILFSLFLTVACQSQQEEKTALQKKRESITFRKFFQTPLSTIDPINTFDVISGHIVTQIYDRLFELDETLEIKPSLIKSYSYEAETKKYIFTLKRGVFFPGGRELSSRDVLFTFQRFCEGERKDWKISEVIVGCKRKTPSREKPLGIQLIDSFQFSIQLNTHYPPFLINLASHNFSILPDNFGGLLEKNYFQNPLGTGPYMIESWDNQKVVLKSNSKYFQGRPKIDRVIYNIVDFENAKKMMQKGELDDLWPLTPDTPPSSQYLPYQVNFASVCFLAFDLKQHPFDNIWFRRSLAALIDKKALIKQIPSRGVMLADSFIPYGVLGFVEKKELESFSKEQAQFFLKKAGFKNFNQVPPLTLYATQSKWADLYVPALVTQLKEAGLQVHASYQELGEYIKGLRSGHIDFSVSRIKLNQPETYHLIEIFKSNFPLKPYNTSDSNFDNLLEKSQSTSDRMERRQIYQEANRYITQKRWAVPLFYHLQDTSYVRRKFIMPFTNYLGPEFLKINKILIREEG